MGQPVYTDKTQKKLNVSERFTKNSIYFKFIYALLYGPTIHYSSRCLNMFKNVLVYGRSSFTSSIREYIFAMLLCLVLYSIGSNIITHIRQLVVCDVFIYYFNLYYNCLKFSNIIRRQTKTKKKYSYQCILLLIFINTHFCILINILTCMKENTSQENFQCYIFTQKTSFIKYLYKSMINC